MSIVNTLIPSPYRWLLWLAAAAIFASTCAWAGHKATQAYYQPKVETLTARAKEAEDRAVEFETAYKILASTSQRQNEGINKLRTDAAKRQHLAEVMATKAKAESALFEGKATGIMRLMVPLGSDECAAAREAFDIELREERGK